MSPPPKSECYTAFILWLLEFEEKNGWLKSEDLEFAQAWQGFRPYFADKFGKIFAGILKNSAPFEKQNFLSLTLKNKLANLPLLIWRILSLLFDLITKRNRILVIAHPRTQSSETYYYNLYTDPFFETLSRADFLILQPGKFLTAHSDNTTRAIEIIARFFAFFSRRNKKWAAKFEILISDVKSIWGIQYSGLADEVESCERRIRSEYQAWRIVLFICRPKTVVCFNGYFNLGLVRAARKMKLHCIELQHGTINKYHLGYSYPPNATGITIPDFIFTWGSFWSQSVSSIGPWRAVTIGFPWFESCTKDRIKEQKLIDYRKPAVCIILSQGLDVSAPIYTLAKKIAELFPLWIVKIRTHPTESIQEVQKMFNWPQNIVFSDSKKVSLYDDFFTSDIQVGVSSSAIFEGLAVGLQTFILTYNGWEEYLRPLVDLGYAQKISSIESFREIISSPPAKLINFNREEFFAANAVNSFRTEIGAIIRN